jgi:hypothetical protein
MDSEKQLFKASPRNFHKWHLKWWIHLVGLCGSELCDRFNVMEEYIILENIWKLIRIKMILV